MPHYDNVQEAGAAAYDALYYLARHIRHAPNDGFHVTTGELLGISRTLPDVLRKLSAAVLARNDAATVDSTSTERSGARVTEEAARQLLAAADLIDTAETRLDRASQHLSVLIWERDDGTRRPDVSPVLTTTRVPESVREPAEGSTHAGARTAEATAQRRSTYQPLADPFDSHPVSASPSQQAGLSR